jgi:hypothetical protein
MPEGQKRTAETVEKPFSIVNGWFLGGLMTPRNYEIIDCGAFCEVIFFCISPKNLPGDFFDSLAIFWNLNKFLEFNNLLRDLSVPIP